MSDALVKQPREDRLYDMDFSDLLGELETITTVDSVIQEKWDSDLNEYVATTDLTIGSPSTNGTLAQARISGGDDTKTYKVTFLVSTDANNDLEGEGILSVVDL